MAAPQTIDALDRSGIGIVEMSANPRDRLLVKLRFADPAGMPVSDDAGGLGLLAPPATQTAPTSEDGPIDLAAVFTATGATSIEGVDLEVGATALPRDITIQAIVAWDFTAQNTAAVPGVLVARGLGNSAIERMPFALELHVTDFANRLGELRFRWHTAAGVLKTETGGAFSWKAPDGTMLAADQFVMFTATRRWISPTSVVIRYYLNDQLLAEVASADGDISSSVDGHTTIGARYTGAAYDHHLCGAIDELAIFGFEMCAEEITATWARLYEHQRAGYRIVQELLPPGLPISNDPASRAQQDLRSMALGLGFASGLTENLRQNVMPDRAYGDVLRRWERITREPARPGDSLDVRRARVVGHIGSRLGVSVAGVQVALAEVLDDLPVGENLQVFAYDNTIRDDFSALVPERWRFDPSASWTVTGGELRAQAIAGSFPWDDTHPSGTAKSALLNVEAPRTRDIPPIAPLSMVGSLNPVALPANSEAGIVFWNWAKNSLFFLGLRNTGGVYSVGYQRYRDGAPVDAVWTVAAVTALQRHWFRLRWHQGAFAGTALEQDFDLSYSIVGSAEANYTTLAPLKWIRDVGWAGFYFRTFAATAGAADVRFTGADFAFRNELGTRPFYFYVYRDPALGGSPDFVGADRILSRMKHGFTRACSGASRSFLFGDPGSILGCSPLGSI